MSGETNLYDFEAQIEDAVAAVLSASDMQVVTPRTAGKFQKARPRIEVLFQTGHAKQSYHVINGANRNASWAGSLTLTIVTQPGDPDTSGNPDSSEVHRQYRARLRNLMATSVVTLNGSDASNNRYLPYHQIQNVVENGTTPKYATDKGYEMSTITFAVDFGIHKDAWAELTT